jgi:hypothetical protein
VRDRDWGWEGASRVGFREGIEFSLCMKRGKGEKRESGVMNYDVMIGWDWI